MCANVDKSIRRIVLRDLLPCVFAHAPHRSSQVWQQSLSFCRGESYMITANSGVGKSSLCSYIYGNRNDYTGNILFDDCDIRLYSLNDWSRLRTGHLALLPQEMRLFPELTVIENIEVKNRLTRFKTLHEIIAMLDRLEIADKRDVTVAKLSVGQQQRVAIVRALCQPMDFLLLDEPVSHLDDHCNELVSHLIVEEATRQGAGIIATSVGNRIKIPIAHELML